MLAKRRVIIFGLQSVCHLAVASSDKRSGDSIDTLALLKLVSILLGWHGLDLVTGK